MISYIKTPKSESGEYTERDHQQHLNEAKRYFFIICIYTVYPSALYDLNDVHEISMRTESHGAHKGAHTHSLSSTYAGNVSFC